MQLIATISIALMIISGSIGALLFYATRDNNFVLMMMFLPIGIFAGIKFNQYSDRDLKKLSRERLFNMRKE